jgi:hypothetical protein
MTGAPVSAGFQTDLVSGVDDLIGLVVEQTELDPRSLGFVEFLDFALLRCLPARLEVFLIHSELIRLGILPRCSDGKISVLEPVLRLPGLRSLVERVELVGECLQLFTSVIRAP